MKSLRIALVGLVIALTSIFAVTAKANNPSLTVSGVTLTWPATIYMPVSSSQVTMTITNNSGRELLYAKYSITDRFGTQVADASKISVPVGANSITANWYATYIDRGTAPFTLTFYIEYFTSAGLPNPPPVSTQFDFTSRSSGSTSPAPTVTVTATPAPAPTVTVTATPAPAPTVTVTATPAAIVDPFFKNEVTRLQNELTILRDDFNLLKKRMDKICKVKPKPKFC
jgi:hypothetical protein